MAKRIRASARVGGGEEFAEAPARKAAGAAQAPKKRGVKPGTASWRKFAYTPELLEDCRRRYEDTPESNVSIARDYGISDKTVRRLAQDHGWTKFPVSRVDLPAAVRLRQRAAALAQGQGALTLPPRSGGEGRPPTLAQQATADGAGGSADSKATPTPIPSPQPKSGLPDFGRPKAPNSGKPEFGWGGEENAARAGQDVSACLAAAVDEVLAGVRDVLAEVRAMRAGKGEPRTPLDVQRLAQTYASLNATLQDLMRAQGAARSEQHTGQYDDDIPADLDEFRRRLARRIDAFVASRTEPGDGDGNAAQGDDGA